MRSKVLAFYGGLSGVRAQDLLESALANPINLLTCGKPTLSEFAASYVASVVRNHPFVDGNKRTGFILAMTFLEINGYKFHATEVDAAVQTLALAAGALDEEQYAGWLKDNASKST